MLQTSNMERAPEIKLDQMKARFTRNSVQSDDDAIVKIACGDLESRIQNGKFQSIDSKINNTDALNLDRQRISNIDNRTYLQSPIQNWTNPQVLNWIRNSEFHEVEPLIKGFNVNRI